MNKDDKLQRKWMSIVIKRPALFYSPEKVAHKLYHFYKRFENELGLDVETARLCLKCDFMWEEDKIDEFEEIFNRLTKYVRKNI